MVVRWMKRLALAALSFGPGLAQQPPPQELVISCGATGAELQQCRLGAGAWSKLTGIPVKVVPAPTNTTERLALYQQLLGARSPDIDVLTVDIVWPGILGSHFLDLQSALPHEERQAYFKAFMDNNWHKERLVAVPWFIGAGLLYYRQDLLDKHGEKVPDTWKDLERIARRIQGAERAAGHPQMWGYVFQGRAYEGLTCNALEWLVSHGAGTVVSDSGAVTVDSPQAAQALDLAASWVGAITPPGVLNYMEEEARGVFQTGNAVFMRNWPYAYALAQAKDSPVRGRIGVSPLPKGEGGSPAATLGGWSLAVSRYSRNSKAAINLVKYLTGQKEQRRRAMTGEFHPTLEALYSDRALLAKFPHWKALHQTLLGAVARPSKATGTEYNRVSAEFWEAAHRTLARNGDAKTNLGVLAHRLNRLRRRGRW